MLSIVNIAEIFIEILLIQKKCKNFDGYYEMDYYFHSFKAASGWLIEHELKPDFDTADVKIGSTPDIIYG